MSHLKFNNLIKRFLLIPGIVLVSSAISFSQNESKKWYFGLAAALDFMSSPPGVLNNSSMTSPVGFNEGTASVADAAGHLLFYTDGITIWNRTHMVMANGSGLKGDYSTTQSALIVKQPGAPGIYFVFSLAVTNPTQGLSYSVVDMKLAAGMGSVTIKNMVITMPSSEKLTGTRHCNGVDTWVISHDYNSNTFRSLLVTAAGISNSFTLSSVGTSVTTLFQTPGAMKVSPTGKKLACGLWNSPGTSFFELYDFDNMTGKISNQMLLPVPAQAYGCEFSPNGTRFYGSAYPSDTLYQWDLCAGSASAINNSRVTIPATAIAGMQLAPDGKIYLAREKKQMLGVINNPDLPGIACNYVDQGQSVAPNTCSYGLPNTILERELTPFTYTISPAISCNTATFSLPPLPTTTVTGCTTIGYTPISYKWYFGDPASGSANSSILANPVHNYPGHGTYTACLVFHYNNSCGGINTDTIKREVKVAILPIVSSAGFNLCSGDSLTLSAPPVQTHSWSTGSLSNSITVSPTVNTTYTVYSSDAHGCTYISEQMVTVYNYPAISIKGNTVICPGFFTKLTASGATTYSWTTGSTYAFILPTPTASTTYTVLGNTAGCVSQETVTVIVQRPEIKIHGTTTLCPGAKVTHTASGAESYMWNNGTSSNTIVLSPSVTTAYTVQGTDSHGCTNTASVLVKVQTKVPVTGFNYQSPVCEKSAELKAQTATGFNHGGVYSAPGLVIDPVSGMIQVAASPTGTYTVNYFFPSSGCMIAAGSTATVIILPAPQLTVVPELSIATGASITFSAGTAASYTWAPAEHLSCVNCPNPVATPPKNMVYCVTAELNSCISKGCTYVTVSCESANDYSMPNAFTPNGDGRNDAFCLQGWSPCMTYFNIAIFNRWGEKVFESEDPAFCWDGVYRGELLGADVFVYVVSAKRNNQMLNRKGNIALIR